MSKFHVNPSTGNPGRCFALKKCRFGGEDEHYASKELASLAYEKFQNNAEIPTLRKSESEITDPPKVRLEDFAVNLHEPKGELLSDEAITEIDGKFSKLRKTSAAVMRDFRKQLELSNGMVNTSVRYENGRALVSVAGSSETNFDGDYPVGDLTTDSETVSSLIKEDPELMFINGDCATLAWDLYDAYPEKVKCVSEIWVKDDVGSMHVIAELKDGTYVDGLGHWTPGGILSAWKGLMGQDVEIRLGEIDESHKKKAPMFESTRILGQYLDRLQ